jgi:hypothetical protein
MPMTLPVGNATEAMQAIGNGRSIRRIEVQFLCEGVDFFLLHDGGVKVDVASRGEERPRHAVGMKTNFDQFVSVDQFLHGLAKTCGEHLDKHVAVGLGVPSETCSG